MHGGHDRECMEDSVESNPLKHRVPSESSFPNNSTAATPLGILMEVLPSRLFPILVLLRRGTKNRKVFEHAQNEHWHTLRIWESICVIRGRLRLY